MDAEKKYMSFGNALVGITGKDVLEVGGCISPKLVKNHSPKSWTSIDINSRRFENKQEDLAEFGFKAEEMSVTSLDFEDESFDRVFSVNCFEHVDDMKKAFAEMYRVLRKGGLLFTIFGPIWSSPVGHHTHIGHNGELYHFNNGVFPDWLHLTKNRGEFKDFLRNKYDEELAERIASYVCDSNDLNRLTDGDFFRLINDSDFSKRLGIFQKKGAKPSNKLIKDIKSNYPNIIDPRNTELLLVLSKGSIDLSSRFRMYLGLGKKVFEKVVS